MEGFSDAKVRLFGAKNSDFSKFMVYPHEQGEKSIFRDVVRTADVFYKRPLNAYAFI